MKKNTRQCLLAVRLICCTLAILTCGVFVGCKGAHGKPSTPNYPTESNDNYTKNY